MDLRSKQINFSFVRSFYLYLYLSISISLSLSLSFFFSLSFSLSLSLFLSLMMSRLVKLSWWQNIMYEAGITAILCQCSTFPGEMKAQTRMILWRDYWAWGPFLENTCKNKWAEDPESETWRRVQIRSMLPEHISCLYEDTRIPIEPVTWNFGE